MTLYMVCDFAIPLHCTSVYSIASCINKDYLTN